MKVYRCLRPTVLKSVETGRLAKMQAHDLLQFKNYSRDLALVIVNGEVFSLDRALFNSSRFCKE